MEDELDGVTLAHMAGQIQALTLLVGEAIAMLPEKAVESIARDVFRENTAIEARCRKADTDDARDFANGFFSVAVPLIEHAQQRAYAVEQGALLRFIQPAAPPHDEP